jgi:hypothetical protein
MGFSEGYSLHLQGVHASSTPHLFAPLAQKLAQVSGVLPNAHIPPSQITHCYAFLLHGGIPIPHSDLLPSLLFKINENQLALEAAIMELTLWVEQRGAADVADNVRSALDAIDRNEEFIKMTLAVMMAPE